MRINRRDFLYTTGGAMILAARGRLSAQDLITQLSEECAAVLREVQSNGIRVDHIQRLASHFRIAANGASLDEQMVPFFDQLRWDPDFYNIVLNANSFPDVMQQQITDRGLDSSRATYLLNITPIDQRDSALQTVLNNGVRRMLMEAAGAMEMAAAQLSGATNYPPGTGPGGTGPAGPTPVGVCNGLAFGQFSTAALGIGFGYWSAVSGVLVPELLLLFAVLSLSAAVIRFGVC